MIGRSEFGCEDRLAKAKLLASHLNTLAAEAAHVENRRCEQDWEADGEAPWSLDYLAGGWRGLGPLVETAEALDRALEEAGFDAELPPVGAWDFFSLGTMTLYGKPRQIHAGFVQPVLRLPVITRLTNRVIAFLTQIPGDHEWLEGENHSNLG
jgi:hypothetical protein